MAQPQACLPATTISTLNGAGSGHGRSNDASATQDLLPVRMINEHVCCPRLFYLEHGEQIFVHNADTLAGKTAHGRRAFLLIEEPQKSRRATGEALAAEPPPIR